MSAQPRVTENTAGALRGQGSEAPSQEELKKQFEELRERFYATCTPLIKTASAAFRRDDIKPIDSWLVDAWLVYAFDAYDYIISGSDPRDVIAKLIAVTIGKNVNEIERRVKATDDRTLRIKMNSLTRVIESCDKNQNFVEFAGLGDDVRRAEEKAKEEENREILELLGRMKTMTVGEFLSEWEGIVEKLIEYEDNDAYDILRWSIYSSLEFANLFGETLADEIEFLARMLLGATKERAGRVVECIYKC